VIEVQYAAEINLLKGGKQLTASNPIERTEQKKPEGVCCGNCLNLYKKKDGRQVWLCKINNDLRISDPDTEVCKAFVEKDTSFDIFHQK
jgi:hypothetical protein